MCVYCVCVCGVGERARVRGGGRVEKVEEGGGGEGNDSRMKAGSERTWGRTVGVTHRSEEAGLWDPSAWVRAMGHSTSF